MANFRFRIAAFAVMFTGLACIAIGFMEMMRAAGQQ